ncbi:MAG: hypothetical protein OEM83_06610, partial [Gammaproteobacteria bacterium]|nr:hypothetical protein [Gammaproteobacteria bacterium]
SMKRRDQHNGSWSFSLRLLIDEADPIRPRAPKESDHRDYTMSFVARSTNWDDADKDEAATAAMALVAEELNDPVRARVSRSH